MKGVGKHMASKSTRWVQAPQSTADGVPFLEGVHLEDDEEVQWIWTHTQSGSYVSGFKIRKKDAAKTVDTAGKELRLT
jgi:hypothetical protein